MRTSLLEGLRHVDWPAIARVYGNCHATLIGSIVTWWTRQGPDFCAFEAGPRHGRPGTQKAGACDAILAQGTRPEVVVEVEGTNHLGRLEQIGDFLESPMDDLRGLHSGILVAYPTGANATDTGRGREVDWTRLSGLAESMTSTVADQTIIIVTIGKKYEAECSSSPLLRTRNNYYHSSVCDVSARQFLNGRMDGPLCYFPRDAGRAAGPSPVGRLA